MCNIVLHGKMGQKYQKFMELKMFGSQPWVGLFEVCKSLNTCQQSGHVFGMCVVVRARANAHMSIEWICV